MVAVTIEHADPGEVIIYNVDNAVVGRKCSKSDSQNGAPPPKTAKQLSLAEVSLPDCDKALHLASQPVIVERARKFVGMMSFLGPFLN